MYSIHACKHYICHNLFCRSGIPAGTSQAPAFGRKDSLREVKLESGQVIGHVAENVTERDHLKQEPHEEVVMTTVMSSPPAGSDVSTTVAPAAVSPGTSGGGNVTPSRNIPVKVVHLNPDQLKELNINLPNMENAEGPVQVYIIEDSASVNPTGSGIVGAPQEPISQTLVSSTTQPEGAAVVVSDGAVEHYNLISSVGVPFQKSEESGFYSMDLDENGTQVGLTVGALDSGVTETTNVSILESANQVRDERSQSFPGIPHPGSEVISGLVHSEPERSSKEDGVPPYKRRRINSPMENPHPY